MTLDIFRKSDVAQTFQCGQCGEPYESIWIGRHSARPICPACIRRARQYDAPRQQVGEYRMPPMYQRDGSSLMLEVKAWAHKPLPAVAVLEGGPGRGKSAQAHHLAAHYHQYRKRHLILDDRGLMKLDDDTMAIAAKVDILIIDEIGRRSTENVTANICTLLDERMKHDRKTAVITNLQGKDLLAVDARLFSRLKAAERITFTGPDRRGL